MIETNEQKVYLLAGAGSGGGVPNSPQSLRMHGLGNIMSTMSNHQWECTLSGYNMPTMSNHAQHTARLSISMSGRVGPAPSLAAKSSSK